MKNIISNKGFGLLEMMMVLGVLGVVIAGTMVYMSNLQQQISRDRLTSSRDNLVRSVQAALFNKKAYSYTLGQGDSNNADLSICLLGDQSGAVPPTLCNALNGAAVPIDHGFALYSPGATSPLSGPKGSPAYFSGDGTSCAAADPVSCPLAVETWFQASCSALATCAKADDLALFYSITTVAGVKFGLKAMNNVPVPLAYSSLLRDPGSASAANVDAGSVVGSTPGLSCTTTQTGLPGGGYAATFQTTCCMSVGTTVVCKNPNAAGATDFTSDFGKWVGSEYLVSQGDSTCGLTTTAGAGLGVHVLSQTVSSGGTCGDISQPCLVGGSNCNVMRVVPGSSFIAGSSCSGSPQVVYITYKCQ